MILAIQVAGTLLFLWKNPMIFLHHARLKRLLSSLGDLNSIRLEVSNTPLPPCPRFILKTCQFWVFFFLNFLCWLSSHSVLLLLSSRHSPSFLSMMQMGLQAVLPIFFTQATMALSLLSNSLRERLIFSKVLLISLYIKFFTFARFLIIYSLLFQGQLSALYNLRSFDHLSMFPEFLVLESMPKSLRIMSCGVAKTVRLFSRCWDQYKLATLLSQRILGSISARRLQLFLLAKRGESFRYLWVTFMDRARCGARLIMGVCWLSLDDVRGIPPVHHQVYVVLFLSSFSHIMSLRYVWHIDACHSQKKFKGFR